MMKILVSAYACEPNKGSEPADGWNWVQQMARFHEVWVVTRSNNRAPIEQTAFARAHHNVHWVYYDLPSVLKSWKKGARGVQIYYYLWQLGIYPLVRNLHRQIGFDLIHHATFGKYWIPSLLAFLPVPFVFGPVGGGESSPSAFFPSFSWAGKIFELSRDLARGCAALDPITRSSIRRAAVVLATTDQTAAVVSRIGAKRVVVHPQFGMTREEINYFGAFPIRTAKPFRLISMGRLLHWKGVYLALQAFAQFNRVFPESEYWIVGSGPEAKRLKQMAFELGVQEGVTFWGRLPELRDVFGKLAESDVLVHPALHEAFGNACLEALAAGRPVICLDLGGPALQVTEKVGIKVPAVSPRQTISELAKAMLKLAENPELRVAMAHAARKRVEANFHWDTKGDLVNGIYADALLGSAHATVCHRTSLQIAAGLEIGRRIDGAKVKSIHQEAAG